MSADETIEQIRERAAAYALGTLSADEARAVEARLALGDPRYLAEVAAYRSVAEDLAHATSPQLPSPAARARVLGAIAALEAPLIDQDGVRFVRAAQFDWKPGVFDGVEFKILRADHKAGRVTLLTRLAPGTVYPRHQHDDFEELSSSTATSWSTACRCTLRLLQRRARQRPDGIRTVGGCTFVVSTSTRDTLFDERLEPPVGPVASRFRPINGADGRPLQCRLNGRPSDRVRPAYHSRQSGSHDVLDTDQLVAPCGARRTGADAALRSLRQRDLRARPARHRRHRRGRGISVDTFWHLAAWIASMDPGLALAHHRSQPRRSGARPPPASAPPPRIRPT